MGHMTVLIKLALCWTITSRLLTYVSLSSSFSSSQDLRYDPDDVDDFSTVQDERGRAILVAVQAEKRRG